MLLSRVYTSRPTDIEEVMLKMSQGLGYELGQMGEWRQQGLKGSCSMDRGLERKQLEGAWVA